MEILNDLLTFEKMDSGLMVLHRSDENVESFIDSVVSIFHTPARGKDITIHLDLGNPGNSTVPGGAHVLSTDLFSIDKFKMSQVLRNLMSNALKFTPIGGTITVRACFIPDETTATTSITTAQSSIKRSTKSNNNTIPTKSTPLSHRLKPHMRRLSEFSIVRRKSVLNVDKDVEAGNQGVHNVPQVTEIPAQQGMLRISIIDSGAGISPENQKRLFKEIIQFNPQVLQGGGGSGFGNDTLNLINLN